MTSQFLLPVMPFARLFGLRRSTLDPLRAAFFIAALVVCTLAVARSAIDARQYAGIDLRARVIGARALHDGLNPYFYPETPGTPDRLRDPMRFFAEVTRCTYTPALLTLYLPFCELPYSTQRSGWLAAEWSFLLLSIALYSRLITGQSTRHAFVCFALLCFAGSHFWRVHAERGQYYVFILFLVAVSGHLLSRARRSDSWLAGIPLGIAAAFRPSFGAIALPLFILRRPRASLSTILACVACVGATSIAFGPSLWKDFAESGRIYENSPVVLPLSGIQYLPGTGQSKEVIDGRVLTTHLDANSGNISVLGTMSHFQSRILHFLPMSSWPLLARAAAAATIAFLCALLALLWRIRLRPDIALGLSMIVVAALDQFIPMRASYADILYLAPLALLARPLIRTGAILPISLILAGILAGLLVPSLSTSYFQTYAVLAGLLFWLVRITALRPRVLRSWTRAPA